MSDYLWDRRSSPDPDVVDLERVLAPLGQRQPPPALRLPNRPEARGAVAFALVLAAASILIAALSGVTWLDRSASTPMWSVARVIGSPAIHAKPMGERTSAGDGSWIDTGSGGRATVTVGDIGQVRLEPDTRVGLLRARPGDYRLQLDRGTMHALIWSPPGQFLVETPSSHALDLGCAYTMTVNDDGSGLINVTSGWVGFEWRGRESFIPQGAVCATHPERGPGTPRYEDTSSAFGLAIDTIDSDAAPAARSAAVSRVLSEARRKDTLTLWHLLSRVDVADRDAVFDRLASFVPPPAGVTREGIRAGQRRMLDEWWNALGLDSVSWWRVWEQKWGQNRR